MDPQNTLSRAAAAALCLLLAAPLLRAEEPEAADWPTTIARLQQERIRQPSRAMLRQQLAVAHNNYGVELSDQKDWRLAIEQLEAALALEPDNAQFRKNLATTYVNHAQALYRQRQITEALNALEKALAAEPNTAAAYRLRGQIEYDRQRLKEAWAAWQQSLALEPNQPDVEQQLAQLGQELPVEGKFDKLSQAYFDLRYEEHIERPAGFDIRDALLAARREVGSDFAYWPKHKIVVLIYSAESFRALRQETPEWVGGQFDGKIRIPLPGAGLNPQIVQQIIFHEYTHAVIHELSHGRCPTWLNEGLAEYEGRTQAAGSLELLRRTVTHGRMVPWAELSQYFSLSLPPDTVGVAYQQAYSMASYLIERYGFWRLRRVLKALDGGQEWEAALQAEYRLTVPKMEKAWRSWLDEWLAEQPA